MRPPRPVRATTAVLLSAAAIVIAGAVGGCVGSATSPASSASGSAVSIAVLGTENFYAELLGQIGGDRVQATSLLNDPNADPHAYESSPQAAAAVADARLVIVNGLGYDDFMQKLLAASPRADRIVIDVQRLLGLANDANAHVWYDPATMPKVAAAVGAALARLDPGDAASFAAREQAYLASLAPIVAKIAELKATYAGAPVAFTEPVAGYLAQAIGLHVLTPAGFQQAVENGTDPPPADVAAERDLLTGRKVRVLIFNSQVVTPLTQQTHDLAVSNGIPVVGMAETMPPAYRTYQDWQLGQLDQLEQALAKGT